MRVVFSVALLKRSYGFSQRMKNISSNVRSNDTNSMYPPTKAEGIAICSVFIVVDVFIVSGNLLTLALFALSKQLRKRSLFMVISMAFSDLLLGILTLPIYIVIVGSSYRLWNFKISRNLKISFYCVDTALSQASLLSAVFGCVRLGNPDLDLKIWIFGFPIEHKIRKQISRRILLIEILTRHGFPISESATKSVFRFCVRLEI